MADGHFPTLVSATRDSNVSTNPIFVRLTDGTTNVSLTGSSLNVNITGGVSSTQFAEDAVHTSGDLGTLSLAVRQDILASSVSATGDYGALKLNNIGALYTEARQTTHDDFNANVNIQVADTDVANSNPVPVSDAGGSLTVDGSLIASATDLDIRDLTLAQDAVRVSANTSANSETNPIFVKVATAVSGNEIHSYNTASAVAADTASNHDYTVTGATFLLKSIIGAFSGGGKIEVQTGPVASLASKAVAFISKDGGYVQLNFDPAIEVPIASTGTVRVIRTNRQGQAQDVYSTIIGNNI